MARPRPTSTSALPTTRSTALTVNVTDTRSTVHIGVSDDTTWTYEHTFTCDEDKGTHNNTATIVETDQSDSASVTVNCHSLTVSKNADTALTRTWTWTIDKSADQTDLLLSEGQSFTVNYEVEVERHCHTTADHAVRATSGFVTRHPIDAVLNAVIRHRVTGHRRRCRLRRDLPLHPGGGWDAELHLLG